MKLSTEKGTAGFGTLLMLLFIGLKLTGNIDWSWWWVLSPLFLDLTVAVLAIGFIFWRAK